MNIFDLLKDLTSLPIIGSNRCVESVVLDPLQFEIEPLPKCCIDCPKTGDFIVYKVPIRVHPWGVNFIIVNPKIQDSMFKDLSLCKKG